MGRLLEALKRLEPELTAMRPADPIAPVESPADSVPGTRQTAFLEAPGGWRADSPATIGHPEADSHCAATDFKPTAEENILEYPPRVDLGDSQPEESVCTPVSDVQASDNSAFEEFETECEIFQEEHVAGYPADNIETDCTSVEEAEDIESQPFVKVAAEFDSLVQLLDEELPLHENSAMESAIGQVESANSNAAALPVEFSEQASDILPKTEVKSVDFLELFASDDEPRVNVGDPEIQADSTPSNAEPEAKKDHGVYGAMARNILAQLPDEGSVALFFTSPIDGEGKTEMILPLAEALIEESGRRTILVDANLHRPDLTQEWRFTSRKGIFDVLTGEADWWDAVQETGIPKLSILLNNGLPQQNAIVSQPLAFSELLENLKREYRLVLIDAASLAHAESIPMVGYCQGVYLVVRLGHSNRRMVREARQAIAQAGGKLLGCVAVGDVLEPA
jgi:Mrp family chromosome partitioning ATPase